MDASYHRYILQFKQPSGTSRGVLTTKETWFISLKDGDNVGYGECGLLRGLSVDDRPDYESKLKWVCENIQLDRSELLDALKEFPSIQFGLETAFLSLNANDPFHVFPSKFVKGEDSIAINGLVWMGSADFMNKQITDKIASGFKCIKLKIGAIDFNKELDLINFIRKNFTANDIEIRVDANGAFSPDDALEKLKRLSDLNLHSIEQPIQPKQISEMAELCIKSPLPIALDEELIGIFDKSDKNILLEQVKPQYIILKPSLVGGFSKSNDWINCAEKLGINWWITSALESNVGLNAIAQWTYTLNNKMYQGLGTGALFNNNFDSPLNVKQGALYYEESQPWYFKL